MSEWWGGDREFEYVHEKYWPALVGMCDTRRQAWMEKWKALGGTVGLKEWDYKGGESGDSTVGNALTEKIGETSALPIPQTAAT